MTKADLEQLATQTAEKIRGVVSLDRSIVHPQFSLDKFMVQAILEALQTALQQEHGELKLWREWAQFVYLGGGPVSSSDTELRAGVCATHDKQLAELQTALASEHGQKVIREMIEWAEHFATGELLPSGYYAHMTICSGNWRKPTGESGCVCNPRLKSARAKVAELETALAQSHQEQWQPIATAPKNYSTVLVACECSGLRSVRAAFWSTSSDGWITEADPQDLTNVTHWMPLPQAPPKETEPS